MAAVYNARPCTPALHGQRSIAPTTVHRRLLQPVSDIACFQAWWPIFFHQRKTRAVDARVTRFAAVVYRALLDARGRDVHGARTFELRCVADDRSGLRAHPVIGHEVAASEFQQFTVGGVVHRFDANNARRDCGRVCLEMLEELELGGGWADDQDFASIFDCVGDCLVVRVMLRRPARANNAMFVMQVLMLRLRMDDTCFGIVRVELDDMRFAVVDPYDKVIVAHCVLFNTQWMASSIAPWHRSDHREFLAVLVMIDQRYSCLVIQWPISGQTSANVLEPMNRPI